MYISEHTPALSDSFACVESLFWLRLTGCFSAGLWLSQAPTKFSEATLMRGEAGGSDPFSVGGGGLGWPVKLGQAVTFLQGAVSPRPSCVAQAGSSTSLSLSALSTPGPQRSVQGLQD
jgi:hypothetical protein